MDKCNGRLQLIIRKREDECFHHRVLVGIVSKSSDWKPKNHDDLEHFDCLCPGIYDVRANIDNIVKLAADDQVKYIEMGDRIHVS